MLLISGDVEEVMKDQQLIQSWATLIADQGCHVITFNWRHDHENDITDLMNYINENALNLSLDPDHIHILAFSKAVERGIPQVVHASNNAIKKIVGLYGQFKSDILDHYPIYRAPQIMIAMGANDGTFEHGVNKPFISQAREMGWHIYNMEHSKGEHYFDAHYNDLETASIINQIVSFIVN